MNFSDDVPPRQLSVKLSVDDILYLQRIFLITGLHHIIAPNISTGRKIMHSLLESMHYFSNTACLTQNHDKETGGYNLLDQLTGFCGKKIINSNALEEFFLEEFDADFLWIELNEILIKDPVFIQALCIMHNLEIAHKIPVVAISYQNEQHG